MINKYTIKIKYVKKIIIIVINLKINLIILS
jgi:hypothetical protein